MTFLLHFYWRAPWLNHWFWMKEILSSIQNNKMWMHLNVSWDHFIAFIIEALLLSPDRCLREGLKNVNLSTFGWVGGCFRMWTKSTKKQILDQLFYLLGAPLESDQALSQAAPYGHICYRNPTPLLPQTNITANQHHSPTISETHCYQLPHPTTTDATHHQYPLLNHSPWGVTAVSCSNGVR